jgi:ribosome-associated heat shock protein Hsp15
VTDSQRIDKWLWYARFFKTRGLASQTVQAGKVRVTVKDAAPERISKAAQLIRRGDVLTFPKGEHVRVIKVLEPGTRRGPATEAQGLYEDLSPPQAKSKGDKIEATEPGARERGAGRPTKKDRRAMDQFKGAAESED